MQIDKIYRASGCVITGLWMLAASFGPVGCEDNRRGGSGDDDDSEEQQPKSSGEQVCAAMAEQLQSCGAAATPCDQALVGDCSELVGVLSEGYLASLLKCVEGGGGVMACLTPALEGISRTPAHDALVTSFCKGCIGPGADLCIQTFFSPESPVSGAPNLLMPLGDNLVDEISATCTTDTLCATTFLECAKGVIAQRAVPDQTLECTINTLISPPEAGASEGCGSDNGGGGNGAGGDDGGGGNGGGNGGSGGTTDCTTQTGEACLQCVCEQSQVGCAIYHMNVDQYLYCGQGCGGMSCGDYCSGTTSSPDQTCNDCVINLDPNGVDYAALDEACAADPDCAAYVSEVIACPL